MKIWLLLLGACIRPGSGKDTFVDERLGPPGIQSFEVSCDVDAAKWTIDVFASSWTTGGEIVLTVDGTYVERHDVTSQQVAADGSSDHLSLSMNIVSDWRDATGNAQTAFLCADDPALRFVVYDLDGQISDCRNWGENQAVLGEVAEVPPCEISATSVSSR